MTDNQRQDFLGALVTKVAAQVVAEKGGKIVEKALDKVASRPSNDIKKADVPEAADQVVNDLQKEVKSRVDHRLDLEPAVKSRNVWGSFVAFIGACDVIYRLWIDDQLNSVQDYLGPIGIIAGVLTPLYSRYIAKKPLGE